MSEHAQPLRGHSPHAELRAATALFYVTDLNAPRLSPDDEHHACDVLRLSSGSTVALSDGAGAWRLAELASATGSVGGRPRGHGPERKPRLELVARSSATVETVDPTARVAVGFALQKGDRTEWTVQKLTELGVDDLVPFISERTIVRLDEARARQRGERLRKVAREASAQSRRVFLPTVADPRPLSAALCAAGVPPVFAEPGGTRLSRDMRAVFVGPEGGWSDRERALVSLFVGLGPTVLRSETAAVVAGTLLVALRAELVAPL